MSKNSYTGPSHVHQVIFNMAAFMIVVAGMRAASDILIPFLLAIFISVIANPLVTKLSVFRQHPKQEIAPAISCWRRPLIDFHPLPKPASN